MEKVNHNICMYCKFFRIMDDEVGCITDDNDWIIVSPNEYCDLFDEETFKPVLKMRHEMLESITKNSHESGLLLTN